MNSKLVQLAVDLSFERIVYTGKRLILVNLLLIIVSFCMLYFPISFISRISSGLQLDHIISIVVFFSGITALIILGNRATTKVLNTKFWRFSERAKEYRDIAISKLMLEIGDVEKGLNKRRYKQMMLILNEEHQKIKDRYNRYLIAFLGLTGVVWYHFIAKLFSLPSINNLEETLKLFGVLIIFCVMIICFRWFASEAVVLTTKLGKIEDLMALMEEAKDELSEKLEK